MTSSGPPPNAGAAATDVTVTPESDLSLPDRRIHVVTTASLPWMTGTAVNPLLRALYLIRHPARPKVTLVVPWLVERRHRSMLYGAGDGTDDRPFDDGTAGRDQQRKFVGSFLVERCGASHGEVGDLHIVFYDATYVEGFGSIFPTVDVCSLIPRDEADVAVLEEPEHLNWINIPPAASSSNSSSCNNNSDKGDDDGGDDDGGDDKEQDEEEGGGCGWHYRFRHVVGVIHTNYPAYAAMTQSGLKHYLAPPAVGALSALVVRAYCDRVIRLSATLPEYAPAREVTENVHGVRSEFFPSWAEAAEIGRRSDGTSPSPMGDYGEGRDEKGGEKEEAGAEPQRAATRVYYIGKLLWPKGFDHLLDIQEEFRRITGDYFPLDVYGGGPDERSIKRAFYGRPGRRRRKGQGGEGEGLVEDGDGDGGSGTPSVYDQNGDEVPLDGMESKSTVAAAKVMGSDLSLRSMVYPRIQREYFRHVATDKGSSHRGNDGQNGGNDDVNSNSNSNNSREERSSVEEEGSRANPLSVLLDLPGATIGTGLGVAGAVQTLSDAAIKDAFAMTFTTTTAAADDGGKCEETHFDPPASRYEFRRRPIPARFLGVKNHVLLKTMPYKVFLNPSLSEVLCTTTAEALAMNKFVVLPRHPSNEFFYRFPNCLTYGSAEEAVLRLIWATDGDREPRPLDDDLARALTWEAATERFVAASAVPMAAVGGGGESEREVEEEGNMDGRIAWLHREAGKRGEQLKCLLLPS